MALKKPSYDTNRTHLADKIPLSSPFTIHIEATRHCNLKCFFCIHTTRGVAGGVLDRQGVPISHMDMKLWDKVVNNIMEFPEQPRKVIFCGLGEPLMNPRLGEMIRKLRAAGCKSKIDIITNGVLLTPELSDELVEAGVTWFRISVNATTSKRYEEICGMPVDMDKFLGNIRYLYEHRKEALVHTRITNANLTEDERKHFYEMFDGVCDTIGEEQLILSQSQSAEFRSDYGLTSKIGVYGVPVKDINVCTIMFYAMQVVSNGDVYNCAVTGIPKNAGSYLGDLNGEETLLDIWNGKRRFAFAKRMLTDFIPNIPVCDVCDCVKTTGTFDGVLDGHAQDILARLERPEAEKDGRN